VIAPPDDPGHALIIVLAMKKIFWLTSLTVACWGVLRAQQPEAPDSSTNLQKEDGSASLFVNFSAVVKESNKVLLQWDVDSAMEGDYFVIERGVDGSHYETIGVLRRVGNLAHYELTDLAPPNGSDFYRIKYTGQTGQTLYSKVQQLSTSGEIDFKFYPNPVDKLFIIRTAHTIDIQIVDATGATRLSKRLQPGIQVVNISTLERGVYILRVADKESNRTVSNQLLKN
jgi:hypothetical protein